MTADSQGYVDPLPWARATPATEAEAALVAASVRVYREQRQQGVLPADAWARITDLSDDAMVRPVMRGETRLGVKPS